MPLFSKAEYMEIYLPFVYDASPDDLYAGLLSIEAYGEVLGKSVYCYVSYYADTQIIDELSERLADSKGRRIKVIFKIKNGKIKSFKIPAQSLAEAYGDSAFEKLELMGYGLHEKSAIEYC